jgi:phosphate transport system permease protein
VTASQVAESVSVGSLLPTGADRRRYWVQAAVRTSLFMTAALMVGVTVLIVFALLPPALEFFGEVSPADFFSGTTWAPLFNPAQFGVIPIVVGSLMVSSIALLVAVPIGLGAAFYLSEYAHPRVRRVVKPILEILAGIPTVVFGFFGLYFVNPDVVGRFWPFGDVSAYTALGAGLVTGMLIVPTVASLSEDAMSAVPTGLREGAFALGATRREVCTGVVFRAALSGIIAAVVLAVARAIGETTIALMVAGSNPRLTSNPGEGVQTMAGFIGFAGIGDQPTGSTGYKTIFAVGLVLFGITLVLNMVSNAIVRRFREQYE